jgi:hypothetical protein
MIPDAHVIAHHVGFDPMLEDGGMDVMPDSLKHAGCCTPDAITRNREKNGPGKPQRAGVRGPTQLIDAVWHFQ